MRHIYEDKVPANSRDHVSEAKSTRNTLQIPDGIAAIFLQLS